MREKRDEIIILRTTKAEKNRIYEKMLGMGIRSLSAYIRKMALNGYVLHVDLAPVKELVSLLRRCSNNINQVAIQANTYGGIYPGEIESLRLDYDALWERTGEALRQLAELVVI